MHLCRQNIQQVTLCWCHKFTNWIAVVTTVHRVIHSTCIECIWKSTGIYYEQHLHSALPHISMTTLQLSVGVSCLHGASETYWRESPKRLLYSQWTMVTCTSRKKITCIVWDSRCTYTLENLKPQLVLQLPNIITQPYVTYCNYLRHLLRKLHNFTHNLTRVKNNRYRRHLHVRRRIHPLLLTVLY